MLAETTSEVVQLRGSERVGLMREASAQRGLVMVAEPNASGHRLYYLRLIANRAAARGNRVVVLLSADARTDPACLVHLQDLHDGIEIQYGTDFSLRGLAAEAIRAEASHLIVPDGDRLVFRLGIGARWTAPATLTCLVMREKAQPRSSKYLTAGASFIRTTLMQRAKRLKNVRIAVLKSGTWRGESKFVVARDPSTFVATTASIAEVQRNWELDSGRYWFGVVGAVGARKNVGLLLQALVNVEPKPGVLLAGPFEEGLAEQLEQPIKEFEAAGGAVVKIPRLLSDLELDSAIGAVECVVLAHSNEGPSGIFGKALLAGTRVLAAGAESLRRDVRESGYGEWVHLTTAAVREGADRVMSTVRPAAATEQHVESFTDPLLGDTS